MIAQWVEALATKSIVLYSVPGARMLETLIMQI